MIDALDAEPASGAVTGIERQALYRTPGLTSAHIERYACALLREWLDGRDLQFFDAVHVAFVEIGIHPLSPFRCEGVHFDTLIDRVNQFADCLCIRLAADRHLQQAVSIAVTAALHELTAVASAEHPDRKELIEWADCCAPQSTTHIEAYDVYAVRIAHVAACGACESRIGTENSKSSPVSADH